MDDIHIPCIVWFHGDPPPDLSHMADPIRIPFMFRRHMAYACESEHAELPMPRLATEEAAWTRTDLVDPVATPSEGAPNSWYTNPGSGQMRLYGPSGLPALDIDPDHDHGAGSPHMHIWLPNPGGFPSRGPGIPLPPGF